MNFASKNMDYGADVLPQTLLRRINHEVRTPLTTIISAADTILAFPDDESARKKRIGAIQSQAMRVLKIWQDVFDIAQVASGSFPVKRGPLALQAFLTDLYADLIDLANERKLNLIFRMPQGIPNLITTDSSCLQRLLLKLLENALQFTQNGRVSMDIYYRADEKGKNVIGFAITDTGEGFEADKVKALQSFLADGVDEHLFLSPFTGLGFVLAKAFSRVLCGNVELKATGLDRGSSFVVEVDAGETEQTRSPEMLLDNTHSMEKADKFPTSGLENLNLLLIEDSDENREMFQIFLELAGANVCVACDGREGLKQAAMGRYDAFLVDIQMPILDGYSVLKELKEKYVGVPALALTAHTFPEDQKRCREAGFMDVLPKPIEALRLVRAVQNCVARSRDAVV